MYLNVHMGCAIDFCLYLHQFIHRGNSKVEENDLAKHLQAELV